MEEQFTMPALLWLECLPKEIRNKAFYNCHSQGFGNLIDEEFRSFGDCLRGLFVWSLTEEGGSYWCSLAVLIGEVENE